MEIVRNIEVDSYLKCLVFSDDLACSIFLQAHSIVIKSNFQDPDFIYSVYLHGSECTKFYIHFNAHVYFFRFIIAMK